MNEDLDWELQSIIKKAEDELKQKREFIKAQELYTKWLHKATKANDSVSVEDERKLKENIALAFNNRGQLRYYKVDFDGAVEDYNKALEFNQTLPSAFYNRGTIMYRMGYFDKALKDFNKAYSLIPECKEFLIALEKCKLELMSS